MFPDGTVYFYSGSQGNSHLHPLLYLIKFHGRIQCGVCLLRDGLETEAPLEIHKKRTLAENGNPEMHGFFVNWLSQGMGLAVPRPNQSLYDFRLARKQYIREPNRKTSPVTSALWDMFGKQPRMAKPLLQSLLGSTDAEIAAANDISIYRTQLTVAKGVNMAVRYLNVRRR